MLTSAAHLEQDFANVVAEVGDRFWRRLQNKQILITGGTGFFGKWLLSTWRDANERFRLNSTLSVVSRNPSKFLEAHPEFKKIAGLKFIEGDVATFTYDEELCDFIIHAAADISKNSSADAALQGFKTAKRMAEFCDRYHPTDFLFVSSGAVYAALDHGLITESDAISDLETASPYAVEKIMTEWILKSCVAAAKSRIKIARCFAFGGPYLPLETEYALSSLIRNATTGDALKLKGDGTAIRSYMDAADLTVWLWRILLSEQAEGAFNVGSDQEVTIVDLAREVATIVAAEANETFEMPEVQTERKQIAGLAPGRYVPCITKAKSGLGLSLSIDRATMLRRTLRFHLDRLKT